MMYMYNDGVIVMATEIVNALVIIFENSID